VQVEYKTETMEINDFGELNALYKLLGKIKFQEDIDFSEFKEFACSPLIANLHKRLHNEFIEESIKKGFLPKSIENNYILKLDSFAGKTIKRRISELNEKETETLKGLSENEQNNFLKILIEPYDCLDNEFNELKTLLQEKIRKTCT